MMRLPSGPIDAPRLRLRALRAEDAAGPYLAWMADPELTRWLEVRAGSHDEDSLRTYVVRMNESADSLLLGLERKADGRHIGNIKLGPVQERHRRADVGLIIGDKTAWGQGYGSEAIMAVTGLAFAVLGLHKLTAGSVAANAGSIRAFLKAGWREEGRRRDNRFVNGTFHDEVLLGVVKGDWKAERS